MKRVFLFGVIVYSALIFMLNDLPAAVSYSNTAAIPFMAKCLVDISFVAFAIFKMFGTQIHWDDEEIGIHADDVSVPDAWFYGVFGLNLLGNFGWHGYQFAANTGAYALYNSLWFFGEFVALALTFVFYRHALDAAKREQRRAQLRTGQRAAG